MATETATPVNGTYPVSQQSHAAGNPPSAPNRSGNGNPPAPSAAPAAPASSSTGNGDSNGVSKDEVGWYFVEQYYTTLSKNPERLHVSDMRLSPTIRV